MKKILLGDSFEVLKNFESNTIDAVITDPPYGIKIGMEAWDKNPITFNKDFWKEILRIEKPGAYLLSFCGTRTYHRMVTAIEDAGYIIRDTLAWVYGSGFGKGMNISKKIDIMNGAEYPKNKPLKEYKSLSGINYTRKKAPLQTEIAKKYAGLSTALRPAMELIVLAQKPLEEKTYAKNVLKWGTGGLNIDATRFGKENRFPTNFLYEGSKEIKRMLNEHSRFFYCAKSSKKEQLYGLDSTNTHPTVKPITLMRYLVRLITPKNGIILDPFMGTGSTGIASVIEGFNFIGIEQNKEYFEIAKERIKAWEKEI